MCTAPARPVQVYGELHRQARQKWLLITCTGCGRDWRTAMWPTTFRHLADWMREATCPGCGEYARCLELTGMETK